MKKNIFHGIKLITALILLAGMIVSCEYKEIADAEYPEQLIYIPAARSGIFKVNSVALPTESVPTEGNIYRYKVDVSANKFIVPLAAYRSGVDNKGSFTVDISVDTDTVSNLITAGQMPSSTKILTSDKYSLVSSAEMKDGDELAKFDLDIRLDSMLANFERNTIFGIAITISSDKRKTNPSYETVVVQLETRMMKPTANFTTSVNGNNVNFTNTSAMSLGYNWDFGDGSTSAEKSPAHTFAASGSYTVTLTALGITGDQDKSVTTAVVNIP